MFTGLLEWVLIIAAIVVIFNANNLSSWKETAHKKVEALKKETEGKLYKNAVRRVKELHPNWEPVVKEGK